MFAIKFCDKISESLRQYSINPRRCTLLTVIIPKNSTYKLQMIFTFDLYGDEITTYENATNSHKSNGDYQGSSNIVEIIRITFYKWKS